MRLRPLFVLALLAGCTPGDGRGSGSVADTLVVYNAASLSGPMRTLMDTFSRRTGVVVQEEHGASLELARRITELKRVPDVIALADREVFAELLMPADVSWYASFARNRMVVAYTDRSRFAGEITRENWTDVVLRDGVLLGRTDPVMAPAGYRALLAYELAERHYRNPGLAVKLRQATPPARIRGNAADLAALLEAGELDYIIEYESLARSHGFRFVGLPPEIDLGTAARHLDYAKALVRVAGLRDSVTRTGAPILYGLSVPVAAPHRAVGERFAAFVLGAEGRSLLRAGYVDAIDGAELTGEKIPEAVRSAVIP